MAPVSFGRLGDRVAVERLDRVHVDDARRNPFGFERFGGANRLGHQQAGGDECDVRALHQLIGLADVELLVRAGRSPAPWRGRRG